MPLRLLVTILTAVAVIAARRIPLPGTGLDPAHLTESARELVLGRMTPVSLGLAPWVTASLVVELFASLVPSLRRLRTSGPSGRAKLQRAALLLAFALAALQGYGEAHRITLASPDADLPRMVLSYVAGTAALLALASFAGQRGLANGVLVVVAASTIGREIDVARELPRGVGLPPTSVLLGAAIGLTLITVLALRKKDIDGEAPVRAPLTGFWPVLLGGGALAALLKIAVNPTSKLHAVLADLTGFVAAWIALTVVFALILGPLVADPAAMAPLWARATKKAIADAEAEVKKASSEAWPASLTFALLLVLVGEAAGALASFSTDLFGLTLGAALILDVIGELRARRRLGELVAASSSTAPIELAASARALREAGISCFVRDSRQRLLLGVLGPFAPSDVLVAPADLGRAREVLAELFPAEPDATGAAALRQSAIGTTLGLAALLLFYQPTPLPPQPLILGLPALKPELAVLAIDDDPDPLADAGEPPRGVRIRTESVPIGDKGFALRHYAVVVALDPAGVDIDASLLAAKPFFDKLAIPAGEALIFGIVASKEAGDKTLELRTYLVHDDPPAVTSADVKQAAAIPAIGDTPPSVGIGVDGQAIARLKALTVKAQKRRIAIIVDGRVENAPTVMSPIDDGFFQLVPPFTDPVAQKNEIDRVARGLAPR